MLSISGCSKGNINVHSGINSFPDIFPDYINVTIPPNIAPLNFIIKGEKIPHFVSIEGGGENIEFKSKQSGISSSKKMERAII